MKRAALLFIAPFVMGLLVSPAFAEDPPMDNMGASDDMQQQGPPRGQQGMMGGGGMGMMKGGMMKGGGMHQPTVVATSDGGVVVLAGGKLTKYDAGLNLVNEVEMKMGKPPMNTAAPAPDAAPSDAPAADPAAPEPVWHEASQ